MEWEFKQWPRSLQAWGPTVERVAREFNAAQIKEIQQSLGVLRDGDSMVLDVPSTIQLVDRAKRAYAKAKLEEAIVEVFGRTQVGDVGKLRCDIADAIRALIEKSSAT